MKNNTKKYLFFCSSKESANCNTQESKKQKKIDLNFLGKKRFCACNKSKCNKKYCECFSKGEKCNEKYCSCLDCLNKINVNRQYELKYGICCSCQKSGCSQKYCECYSNGKKCNICCNCMDCKNKRLFTIENNSFFSVNNLKKIYIKNENIIINNYKLNLQVN